MRVEQPGLRWSRCRSRPEWSAVNVSPSEMTRFRSPPPREILIGVWG